MKIYLKNMVCQGTRFFVLHELERLGLKFKTFELGEIDFVNDPSLEDLKNLDQSLRKYGLEISTGKNKLVFEVRKIVLDMIENNTQFQTSFSYHISRRAGYNYDLLNNFFKRETGLPIEEYYLEKKSERMRAYAG
jgi:hypothetical protein